MRRLALLLALCAMALTATAQSPAAPPPNKYALQFDSHHGEAFSVFIDGELQNRLPQSRVIVNEVSDQVHEVVVVMKRPAEKCAVLQLLPRDRTVIINVNYDNRLEQLYLYTAAHNRADSEPRLPAQSTARLRRADASQALGAVGRADSVPAVAGADDDAVAAMVLQLKAQNFENNRLSLAKVLVASAMLSSEQIARLAETLDFSNTRVEFLKYAYVHCLDPENYYRTVDVLTFTVDKKKVLDYVATQK